LVIKSTTVSQDTNLYFEHLKQMSKRIKIAKAVLKITEGLLEKVVDATLLLVIFQYEMSPFAVDDGRSLRGSIFRASRRTLEKLGVINYQSVKTALIEVKRRGWIKFDFRRRDKIDPQITEAGLKRLNSVLPAYDKSRKWDGKIYLITYDIPERERRKRDLLRDYLRRLSCAKFQASVWVTLYDPRGVLNNFIEENHLEKNVIISHLGKDGMIGKEGLKLFIRKIYSLDDFNKRYREYIEKFEELTPFESYVKFLSILSDDPQVPFSLLPNNWLGERAYRLFKTKIPKFKIL